MIKIERSPGEGPPATKARLHDQKLRLNEYIVAPERALPATVRQFFWSEAREEGRKRPAILAQLVRLRHLA